MYFTKTDHVPRISAKWTHYDTMKWNTYMDECVRVLTENKDCPTDAIFAAQVLLQRINQKASEISWRGLDPGALLMSGPPTTVPPEFSVRALEAEFEQVRASIAPEILHDGAISLYLASYLTLTSSIITSTPKA
jgi:hypothetical protein